MKFIFLRNKIGGRKFKNIKMEESEVFRDDFKCCDAKIKRSEHTVREHLFLLAHLKALERQADFYEKY